MELVKSGIFLVRIQTVLKIFRMFAMNIPNAFAMFLFSFFSPSSFSVGFSEAANQSGGRGEGGGLLEGTLGCGSPVIYRGF